MYGHQDLHWKDSRLYLGSSATGYSITPDTKYPSMWRVRYPDGSLSDIVNLTRARDGALGDVQNGEGASPPSKSQPKPTEPHIPQVPCPCHAGSVPTRSNPVPGGRR